MTTASLTFGDLRIEGQSQAGEETWFRIHPPGLAFDVGRGASQLVGATDLFLSHGHLDHALGVPYVLSQRSLHDLGPCRVFCPAPLTDRVTRLIRAAESLESTHYRFEVIPLKAGDQVQFGRDLSVEAFASDHSVPSLGYHLVRAKRRLKARFRDSAPAELVEAKAQGEEIEEIESELWLSYCGDTGPAVFELEPRLYEVLILLIECTFLDLGTRDKARKYKHIHLEDLEGRVSEFRNRDLVLHHTSRRYSSVEIAKVIDRRLSNITARVHLFGC